MANKTNFADAKSVGFDEIESGKTIYLPPSEREAFMSRYYAHCATIVSGKDPAQLEREVLGILQRKYEDMVEESKPPAYSSFAEALQNMPEKARDSSTIFVLIKQGKEIGMDILPDHEKAFSAVDAYLAQHGYDQVEYCDKGGMSIVLRMRNSQTGQTHIGKISALNSDFLARGEDLPENIRPINNQYPEDLPEGWQFCIFDETLVLSTDILNELGTGKSFEVRFEDSEKSLQAEKIVLPGRAELLRHMMENSISAGHFIADEAEGNMGYHPDHGLVWIDMGTVHAKENGPLSSQWGEKRREREGHRRDIFGALGPLSHLKPDAGRKLATDETIEYGMTG